MKLPAALSLLSSVSTVSALFCYGGGHTLDAGVGNFHAKRACEGYHGNAGAFQGWFGPNQEKYACVDIGSGVKLEMWVKNLNPTVGFDLGDTDCTKEFNYIMYTCNLVPHGFGGDNDVAGWYFRIDPNGGSC